MSFFDQQDEGDVQFSRGFRWGMTVGALFGALVWAWWAA